MDSRASSQSQNFRRPFRRRFSDGRGGKAYKANTSFMPGVQGPVDDKTKKIVDKAVGQAQKKYAKASRAATGKELDVKATPTKSRSESVDSMRSETSNESAYFCEKRKSY